MKIGLIADTHDNMPNIQKAVKFFQNHKIDLVLHCGDHIAPFSINPFKDSGITIKAIWGNNEGEKLYFRESIADNEMIEIYETRPKKLEIDGRTILLMHEPDFLEIFAQSGEFDLICYGHLHEIENRKVDNCLIVNPGEACGYLSGKATVAIVDLDTLNATIHEL